MKKSGVESQAPNFPESPILMLTAQPRPRRIGAEDSRGSPVQPISRFDKGHFSKQICLQKGRN